MNTKVIIQTEDGIHYTLQRMSENDDCAWSINKDGNLIGVVVVFGKYKDKDSWELSSAKPSHALGRLSKKLLSSLKGFFMVHCKAHEYEETQNSLFEHFKKHSSMGLDVIKFSGGAIQITKPIKKIVLVENK